MTKKNTWVLGPIFFLTGLLCVKSVSAGGFDNLGIGTTALTMGSSFTGLSEDSSAVYYNPAALVFLEKNKWHGEAYVYISTIGFEYTAEYDDQRKITDKNSSYIKDFAIIPGGFTSKTFDRWAIGFGYYIPYAGGGTNYSDFQGTGSEFSGFAGFPAYTVATGYRVSNTLSVGAGISLYSGTMETKNSFIYNQNSPEITTYENEFSELLAGYGGHLSFYYQPSNIWSLGLTVRSEVSIDMDGEEKIANKKFDSHIEFTLPHTVDFGIGYRPNRNTIVSGMLSRRYYKNMNEITLKFSGKTPTYYKNSWIAGLGVKHQINDKTATSGGIKFLQSATTDQGINPGTMDIDTIIASTGYHYKKMNITFLYSHGLNKKINNQSYDLKHYSLLFGRKF